MRLDSLHTLRASLASGRHGADATTVGLLIGTIAAGLCGVCLLAADVALSPLFLGSAAVGYLGLFVHEVMTR